jgi:hypothetical protein
MEETVDLSSIKNMFIRELVGKLQSYLEEIAYWVPEAGEEFAKLARDIIIVYSKISRPGISRYVDMEGLEEYILEYFRHTYMANIKHNGYIYSQIRAHSRARRGIEIGEREKKRIREHEKEYIEDLMKYSLNVLYIKLERLYERVVQFEES